MRNNALSPKSNDYTAQTVFRTNFITQKVPRFLRECFFRFSSTYSFKIRGKNAAFMCDIRVVLGEYNNENLLSVKSPPYLDNTVYVTKTAACFDLVTVIFKLTTFLKNTEEDTTTTTTITTCISVSLLRFLEFL
jgi:hypothetical protein